MWNHLSALPFLIFASIHCRLACNTSIAVNLLVAVSCSLRRTAFRKLAHILTEIADAQSIDYHYKVLVKDQNVLIWFTSYILMLLILLLNTVHST